jgi:hypothetical protein
MTMPNGSGGTMMYMMPTTVDVCDTGYNVCMDEGEQVDSKQCVK